MWGRDPHIFTEQGPIGFKSGPGVPALVVGQLIYGIISQLTPQTLLVLAFLTKWFQVLITYFL